MATNTKSKNRSLKKPAARELEALWSHHHGEWRHPGQIVSQWHKAMDTDDNLLRYAVTGDWWGALEATNATLLITREYEHLILAMSVRGGRPAMSFMPMPHPSGLAVDHARGVVHVASTRNPNQIYDLAPVSDVTHRLDVKSRPMDNRPLVPVSSRFLPGCLYMHDLAIVDGKLYANAVGQNAVVRLHGGSSYERVWWPRCIEMNGAPVFGQNYIQLNSIAAGDTIEKSYFSASCDKMSARRPGHKNFPVDKRGVIFSGKTREAMARGLTRPHSARCHENRIWVDNSGYGEFGYIENESLNVVSGLPGWTRGLCFKDQTAFVGTSRVIPRFSQYAPGLNVEKSVCGIHAVDLQTGKVLGSLHWPYGNQIFAIDWLDASVTTGFPFSVATGGRRSSILSEPGEREKTLFYTFQTDVSQEEIG